MTQTKTIGGMSAQKPSDIRQTSGLLSLVMGRTGSGKTSLLETLWTHQSDQHEPTEYCPVAVLDFDGKSHVLRDLPNLDIYVKPTWKEVDDFTQAIERSGQHSPYKTICYDGTTMLQLATHEGAGVFTTDNPQVRMSRYGDANRNLQMLASRCRTLSERGIHIIFNIWAWAEKEDEQDAYKRILPDITPTLQNKFVGQFDFVVYLERNAPPKPFPPVMRTGGSERYGTNTAVSPDSPLRNIPDKVVDPSWKVIFDAFHGKPYLK